MIEHKTVLVLMITINNNTFINACSFINYGKVKEKHRLTFTSTRRADVNTVKNLGVGRGLEA